MNISDEAVMLADAWDEGMMYGSRGQSRSQEDYNANPYRSQAEFDKQRKYDALAAISELGSDDPAENPYRE